MGGSPDAGYIYILQNESLDPDRLKIGRTQSHPQERAEELSQSTGVPTPFTVVWYGHTIDCVKAERLVHQSLSPFRVNPRREFFDVDLDEAIEAGKQAVDLSGRRLSWFYRPEEQWNLDPSHPMTFAGFCFHRIVRPILRAPVNLVLLCLYLIWLMAKGLLTLLFNCFVFVLTLPKAILSNLLKGR